MKREAKARSKFSLDCICFPDQEQPLFEFGEEEDTAFSVKCPLHGDRFIRPRYRVYVSEWYRKNQRRLRPSRSAQFQKAWVASFPRNSGPAE